MSKSCYYARKTDLLPVRAEMDRHADQGLPFISLEYGDDYLEWTQEGESTMPSYDEIVAWNIEGTNALEPEAYRHLLSVTTDAAGLDFGSPGIGLTLRTLDGRNVSIIPVDRDKAYRRMDEHERKAFEAGMRPPVEGDVDDL
jgi:hypothetical protein